MKIVLAAIVFFLVLCVSPSFGKTKACHITQRMGEPITKFNKFADIGTQVYNLCHKSFQVAFSGVTKTPIWVAEEVTAELIMGDNKRSNDFREDPLLPEGVGSKVMDYKNARNSHYDQLSKGHMAPAADFQGDKVSESESFYMSNIVPQVQICNNSGVWSKIEDLVRDWSKSYGTLFVVTGPIFEEGANKAEKINDRVSVPTHLYKVIFSPIQNQSIGFIVPNSRQCNTTPSDFIFRQADIEKRTELKFFPRYTEGKYKQSIILWKK